MSTSRLRLGQLLIDAKLISASALDDVLVVQRRDGRRLGTLLVERGLINETQLTQILSHQLSVPWVSLLHVEFSRQLLNLVPRGVADQFCLVPIYVRQVRNQGQTLYVAMDDPTHDEGLRACADHSGLPVRAMIAPPSDIRNAIRVYYGAASTKPVPRGLSVAPSNGTSSPPASTISAPPVSAASVEVVMSEPPEASGVLASAPPQASGVLASEPSQVYDVEDAPAVDLLYGDPHEDINDAEIEEVPAPSIPAAARGAIPANGATPAQPMGVQPSAGVDGPEIEAVEIPVEPSKFERLRAILSAEPAPPSAPVVEAIPRPRGRAPRMVALTLLDGTTIALPARAKGREVGASEPPASSIPPSKPRRPGSSEPPASEDAQALTARDLIVALRAVAHGADGSEVLGSDARWESLFAAFLSLMLKKHLIADWEFVEELKRQR